MVTPFTEDLQVDWLGVEKLVEILIEQGNDGIVVCGTTGESPTLTKAEKIKMYETVVKQAAGRVKVVAGTGSNNTAESIDLSQAAEKTGVDAVMLVVPYYNKPSQAGLYIHFQTIAESVKLPVMLYNVPGRTSTNMTADTVIKLSKLSNVCCVKEASGNLAQISHIIAGTADDFVVYSGDDANTMPILAVGGYGVVSVAGHVIGKDIKAMINSFLQGKNDQAAKQHLQLMPIFEGMFITSNPVPVKAALKLKGFGTGRVRPPLADITEQQIETIKRLIL